MAQQNAPIKRRQSQANPDLEGPPLVLPMLTTGLGTRFYNTLEEHRDKLHQVDSTTGITETKGALRTRAVQVALEMRTRGIKPNHVVIICSKSHLDQTVALLACLFVGVTIAPITPDLPYDEFTRIVVGVQPRMAFCGLRSAQLISRILKDKNLTCDIFVLRGDTKDFFNMSRCFEHRVEVQFNTQQIPDPKSAIAFIITTHGSEREPKLVSLSHFAVFARYMSMCAPYTKKSEKILSFFPVNWVIQVLISCICFETLAVMLFSGSITERGICKYVHDLRIEHLYLDSATAVNIINNAPILDFDLSCLKYIYVGGVPMSFSNLQKLKKYFPSVNINVSYKSTEAGIVTSLSEDQQKNGVFNAIGKLEPGVTVRVVDINTRQILGPDRWGELLVKTPGLFLGYYRNKPFTSSSFSRGFFKTGDIVQYDKSGNFYLKGRLGSIINKDGYTFFSSEIEEAILNHEAVKEVAVFEAQDEIVACVVKKANRDLTSFGLLEFLSDLPEYKRPTKIKFYDHFPKTLHGVVRKYVLKDSAIRLIREESFYHSAAIED